MLGFGSNVGNEDIKSTLLPCLNDVCESVISIKEGPFQGNEEKMEDHPGQELIFLWSHVLLICLRVSSKEPGDSFGVSP